MGKFVGPGYVRLGPVTAGPFGIGCLFPFILLGFALALPVILWHNGGRR